MKAWRKFQSHPLASIACIFAGAIFGKAFPRTGEAMGFVGDTFLSLFKMCALPIVVTIILESFYRLMSRGDRNSFIFRAFRVFGASAIVGTAFGISLGRLLSPHVVSRPDLMAFLSGRMSVQPHVTPAAAGTALDFVTHLVPQNIFQSLAEGQIISCLIFFAFFGAALARVAAGRGDAVYEIVRAVKDALFRMLGTFIQFLPVAVFALFARTFSGIGGDGAKRIGELALICGIPVLSLLALQVLTVVAVRRTKIPTAWDAMKEPLLIAFSASSSIVALPSAMKNLAERGKVQEWAAETIMPLSVTFNPQGNVVFNAFLVTFCAGITGMTLTAKLAALIAFGGVVQAICASGLPSLATLSTIAMIFGPLGLPVDLVILLTITIVPFLSPFLATANILGHACTVLFLERRADPATRSDLPPATRSAAVRQI